MKYYISIIISIISFSCNSKNIFQDYEIKQAVTFKTTTELSGQKTNLSPEGILALNFIDSLIIVQQKKMSDYIAVYEKKSWHKLKTLLPKGRGPNEFRDFTFGGQYMKKKHETAIYFSDINQGNLYMLNLTKSLQEDSLNIKCISKIPYRSYPTFLTDSFYISKTYIPEKKELSFLLHDTLARPIDKYLIYESINFTRYNQINSADQIKPDLSKIAMAMFMFNQINILDLHKKHSFSITTSKGSTWLSERYIENHEPILYYIDLKCTDEKIYALYVNQKISEWQRVEKPIEIHIFNWEGEPLYKLKIKESLRNFDIDENNKKLYGLATQEEIFEYDIKEYI